MYFVIYFVILCNYLVRYFKVFTLVMAWIYIRECSVCYCTYVFTRYE